MKNRASWFKCFPGDEERMFRGVDVQAIGLHFRFRFVAFDADPQGFLVDFRKQPLDLPKLADVYSMTNGRFKSIFDELRDRQLIQTAVQFQVSLGQLQSAWASKKIAQLSDLLSGFDTPLADIFVIPTMVDLYLDTLVGSKTGSEGWDEHGKRKRKVKRTADPISPPHVAPPIGTPSTPPHMAQKSEVRSQNPESVSTDDVVRNEANADPNPADVQYIRGVLENQAPDMRAVSDTEIARLLASYAIDLIACTIVEKRLYLVGKGFEYLDVMMATRKREGWETLSSWRDFVSHRMKDRPEWRTGYVLRITMVEFFDNDAQLFLFDDEEIV